MKILQIGDTDIISRRFSGRDLNIALRQRNIEADHLVWWKNECYKNTFDISSNINQRMLLQNYLSKLNSYHSTQAMFYPFSYDLLFDQNFLNSDVIHLHLIHKHFFDISHLPILSRLKPVVWTLHDLWPIQGHCIHPLDCDHWLTGCGDCPDLNRSFEINNDTSALNWEYKKLVFSACEFNIVVASQWMYERVMQSSFFPKSIVHLIRFGLDLSIFKPLQNCTDIRKEFGIPSGNTVIAFRAEEWIYKGFKYIKECLRNLSSELPLTLIVFDQKKLLCEFEDRYQIIEVGWVDDEQELIKIYNAVDIFLMPSVAESFGMMAIEFMACGKPVIVMDQTALPEIVRPEESGCIVVPQGDVAQLTQALERLIADPELCSEIGIRSRATAEKYYSHEDYVSKIIGVYENAMERKKNEGRAKYVIDQIKNIIPTTSDQAPVFPLANVINVFPGSHNVNTELGGINISTREFKFIGFFLQIERSPIIQFLLEKILKSAYKFLK